MLCGRVKQDRQSMYMHNELRNLSSVFPIYGGRNMSIDNNAPIIPFEGIGGIQLYSTEEQVKPFLDGHNVKKERYSGRIRYQVDNLLYLVFLKKNGKLFKITTLDGYKGKLWDKIGTDTVENELLSLDDSFIWDDWEEIWQSPKGVIIEGYDGTGLCKWISVYVKEMLEPEFEKGNW